MGEIITHGSEIIGITGVVRIPPVDKADIRDYGIIERADMKFGSGLNIIAGGAGGGKTTVIKYLLERLNLKKLTRLEQIEFQIQQEMKPSCLLIDGLLSDLSEKSILKVLKELENCGSQVIVTLHWHDLEYIRDKVKANIINLRDFDLTDYGR